MSRLHGRMLDVEYPSGGKRKRCGDEKIPGDLGA